jgi:hypothetical protein
MGRCGCDVGSHIPRRQREMLGPKPSAGAYSGLWDSKYGYGSVL